MSSGPTIVDIPTDGVGSTGFVKSRYAQHDFFYGRAIKTTLANALTANDETTVPSTQAITSLEAQKVDRAGDTMTGNLTLTEADLSARNVSASGTVTAPGLSATGNLTVTDTTTTGTLDVLLDSDLRGNVTVHKNLTVLGSTTTVESNIVTIDDPVIQVGTDVASDTTLDRGVTFLYHDGSNAQTGFFGWDRNLNAFVMRPEATESPQNLIGGALGDIHANEFKGTTLELTQTANVAGATTLQNTLNVQGISTFDEDVNIVNADLDANAVVSLSASGKATTVRGTLNVVEAATFDASATVAGATTINNSFETTGETKLASSDISTTVRGPLTVNQTSTLTGAVTVAGATQINNDLTATGVTTLAAPDVATSVKGSLTVDQASTLTGAVTVAGATQINNALTATGVTNLAAPNVATNVKGSLTVDQASTLTGAVTVAGATQINNALTATGVTTLAAPNVATNVKGSLTVDQTSTLTGAVTVAGATQINNDLTATGVTTLAAPDVATSVKGSLTVDQTSTLTGAVTVAGATTLQSTLGVTGAVTVTGATTLQSTLGVTGDVTVSTSALNFGSTHRKQIHLYGTTYGIGTQTDGVYTRSPTGFRWYRGGEHASTGAGGTGVEAMVLDASGNLTVEKNITSLSDARIKTNVHTLEGVSEKLLSVRGVRYDRKDQPDARHEIGVIAQEIETVFPEVVLTDPKTGLKSVAYANLVGALIQAHNETRTELDALRRELAELRAQRT